MSRPPEYRLKAMAGAIDLDQLRIFAVGTGPVLPRGGDIALSTRHRAAETRSLMRFHRPQNNRRLGDAFAGSGKKTAGGAVTVDGCSWSGRQAWTVASLLMMANSLAFVDRQILAFMVEPIQRDLGFSDTQISLVYGLGFSLLYIAAGPPIAWLADRANRRNIICASILVWSGATSACGLASNYAALFAARMISGAGEAGLNPASYSLLADYFPRSRLAAALGLYQAGIYIGGALALLLGGVAASIVPLHEHFVLPVIGAVAGWQLVLIALGAPGVLLALLLLMVAEPARATEGGKIKSGSVVDTWRHIGAHRRVYFGLIGAFSVSVLVGNATGAWIPAFLSRQYGLSLVEIGRWYGFMILIGGSGGALTGGALASRLVRTGVSRGNLLAALIGFAALVPLTVGFPLMPNAKLALGLIGAMNFFAGFSLGGGLAALLGITPARMRAQVSLIYVIGLNLVGAALGPAAVGILSDYVLQNGQRLGEAIALTGAIFSPLALALLLVAWRALPNEATAR